MIKIKLLKNIPGYKTGEILSEVNSFIGSDAVRYHVNYLIGNGYAEEIQDDIDIEKIRKQPLGDGGSDRYIKMTDETFDWYKSFQTIKAVIEKLNGIEKRPSSNCEIYRLNGGFALDDHLEKRIGWLPMCFSKAIGEKVIALCEPELKVLFGVK